MERKTTTGAMVTLLLINMMTLAFSIQSVQASGTIYIRSDGSVEGTDKIQQDGDVYTFIDNIYDSIVVERSNIVLDGNGYTLDRTASTGFDLKFMNNVTVKNVSIQSFGTGIDLTHASNNIITGDTMFRCASGIRLWGPFCSNNTISGNYIDSSIGEGIDILGSQNNTIFGNYIGSSQQLGIMLASSKHNNIYENNITANGFGGVRIHSCSNNTFFGNNISRQSSSYGIKFEYCSNHTIYGNTIGENTWGIELEDSSSNAIIGNNITNNEYGMWFHQSPDNTLYHNNFIDNIIVSTIPYLLNVWDDGYPSGGNYWSDYAGVDSNEDGIGDTPYVIDVNNQDRYPLMNPWRERIVRVKVGDWAKYTVDVSWTGVLDPRLEMLSETEWAVIEVTDVQGTMVTFTGTSHFKNGSEVTAPGVKWDIAPTGSFGFVFWFISSNLEAGDRLFPIGILTINETITRTYCGVLRENNYVNWSTSFSIIPGPPYDSNEFSCYWDQATGILTDESLEANTEDLSSRFSLHVKMSDTNLWEAPIPTTVGELKTKIDELGSEGEIDNQGTVKSLIAKLNVSQKLMDKDKTDEMIMVLEDFSIQVQELSGIHITVEAADILIESAEYIMSQL